MRGALGEARGDGEVGVAAACMEGDVGGGSALEQLDGGAVGEECLESFEEEIGEERLVVTRWWLHVVPLRLTRRESRYLKQPCTRRSRRRGMHAARWRRGRAPPPVVGTYN